MNKLRIGVIGAGHLGRIHATLLRSLDEVELVGIADPLEEARYRLASQLRTRSFADHRYLLGQVAAAVVATPTVNHHEIGMQLLGRGIHVLVEKPIAANVNQADEMVQLAQRRGLILQTGHVERFNPAFAAAQGSLGPPRYIEAVRTGRFTGRSTDIGVVLDLMIHDLDLVLSLAHSDVVDVQATGRTVFGRHEDLAEARLTFADGCVANLRASRTSHRAQRTMYIESDRSRVELDFAAATASVVHYNEELRRLDVPNLSTAEKRHLVDQLFNEYLPLESIDVTPGNAILEEQRDFVAAIRSQTSPRVCGRQGRDALAVAQQIVNRIQQGLPARELAIGSVARAPAQWVAAAEAAQRTRRAG